MDDKWRNDQEKWIQRIDSEGLLDDAKQYLRKYWRRSVELPERYLPRYQSEKLKSRAAQELLSDMMTIQHSDKAYLLKDLKTHIRQRRDKKKLQSGTHVVKRVRLQRTTANRLESLARRADLTQTGWISRWIDGAYEHEVAESESLKKRRERVKKRDDRLAERESELDEKEQAIESREKELSQRDREYQRKAERLQDTERVIQAYRQFLHDHGLHDPKLLKNFKSILEALREVGAKEDNGLVVRESNNGLVKGRFSDEERNLEYHLTALQLAVKPQEDDG